MEFIKMLRKAFSKEYCNKVIKHFEIADQGGFTKTRRQENSDNSPLHVKDDSYFINESNLVSKSPLGVDISKGINKILWGKIIPAYMEEFPILFAMKDDLKSYVIKVQRTRPGGGYHKWHCEADGRVESQRVLVWQVYLNDIEEGGETEFIYQHKRVKPVAGTALIWPAAFTHTHRGNPPLIDTKYIMTGWIEF